MKRAVASRECSVQGESVELALIARDRFACPDVRALWHGCRDSHPDGACGYPDHPCAAGERERFVGEMVAGTIDDLVISRGLQGQRALYAALIANGVRPADIPSTAQTVAAP